MKAFCLLVLNGIKGLPVLKSTFAITILINLFLFSQAFGQTITNTNLQQFAVSTSTADKPQSKVWTYNGGWYCVMANSSGTRVWKLNGTTWSSVLTLTTSNNLYADVKVAGNLVHILLFDDLLDDVHIRTLEYNTGNQTYQPWSVNPNSTLVDLGTGGGRKTETAAMDIDSQGKMWFCFERDGAVYVRWSNAPYTSWSSNIQIINGLVQRDIAGIIAFSDNQGSKIGVAWANHNTKRFGFKYHLDTNPATTWSSDEIPGNAQALNIGLGMADDHINLATTSDGHVYMAAKTSYDQNGYATLILLDRKPTQSWDYYEVEFDDKGTKPIVVANEAANSLIIAYTYPSNNAGDLVYKVAPRNALGNFASASRNIIINRDGSVVDMASSTKDIWSNKLVVMGYHAVSGTVRSTLLEMQGLQQDNVAPSVPANLVSTGRTFESVDLQWDPSTDNTAVTGYNVFVDGVFNGTTAGTTFTVTNLEDTTSYDFQVSAFDAADNESALSPVLTLSTLSIPPPVNVPPTAALASDITGGVAPITVNFDGSASLDSDGVITSYSWDFGDGNTATGVTANHTYNSIGNYLVVLTVTDDSSATDTDSITIAATDKLNQTITFNTLADKQTTSGPFTLSATANSGLPVSFSLVSGPATISNDTVTLTGVAGTVTVRASQSGNSTYFPAADVDQSFDVLEPGTSVIVSAQVNASSDDAEERLSTGRMDVTSSDLELGYEGIYAQRTAMRFTGLNIPQGSTILNAYVQFRTDEAQTGAANLTVRGQNSDDAVTFPATKFAITSRPQTSASVPWIPIAWATVGEEGPDQQTPDISSVVQEIVDRAGWTTSSAMVILIEGTGVRAAVSYDALPAGAPRLFVEYQPLGGSARKAATQQLATASNLLLYPNPFENEFFLKTDFPGANWMDVVIFNSMGQVVHSEEHLSLRKPVRIQPQLAAGIYSVVIRTDNGQVKQILAVKN